MEGTHNFPYHVLKGVSSEVASQEEVVYSVLDGQQRLTALNLALGGKDKGNRYFVKLGEIAAEGVVDEDHFGYESRKKWVTKYPTVEDEAAAGVIALDDLLEEASFFKWVNALPDSADRDKIIDTRKSKLGGLVNYQFPATVIRRDAPLDVLTNIFVTINQHGVKLSVFDLMVAKTWLDPLTNPPGYDLRRIWDSYVDPDTMAIPRLANYGVDEVTTLRAVKLGAHEGDRPAKSVSNSEIINIDANAVRSHFSRAAKDIDKVLAFLHERAGIIPETLPSEAGLLPIVYVVGRHPAALSGDAATRILSWFWAGAFLERYGRGGTNTLIVRDSHALYDWVVGGGDEPGWIQGFWSQFNPAEDLIQPQSGHEVLLHAILALQTHLGAQDWIEGDAISSRGRQPAKDGTKPVTSLHEHHIFPSAAALPVGDRESHPDNELAKDQSVVLNRALILASSNQKFGATPPSAIHGLGADLDMVVTHCIDVDTLSDWPAFVKNRVALLTEAIETVLPRSNAAAT